MSRFPVTVEIGSPGRGGQDPAAEGLLALAIEDGVADRKAGGATADVDAGSLAEDERALGNGQTVDGDIVGIHLEGALEPALRAAAANCSYARLGALDV